METQNIYFGREYYYTLRLDLTWFEFPSYYIISAINVNFVISLRMNKSLTIAVYRALIEIYMIFLIYSIKN